MMKHIYEESRKKSVALVAKAIEEDLPGESEAFYKEVALSAILEEQRIEMQGNPINEYLKSLGFKFIRWNEIYNIWEHKEKGALVCFPIYIENVIPVHIITLKEVCTSFGIISCKQANQYFNKYM